MAATLYDQWSSYPEPLRKCATSIIPKLLGYIFAKRTRNSADMDKALDIIQAQGRQNHDLAKTAIGAIMADKHELYALANRLADNNRISVTEMVAPIGTGCKTITHFDHTPSAQVIDEPMAEAMRSQEELEVGPQTKFEGTFLGVDRSTGACRIKLNSGVEIRGKITDPALKVPHSIYTSTLDSASGVVFTAKPLLKDGELSKLYISDAHAK
jgi:hypothetical protein